MESTGAHRITRPDPSSSGGKINGKPGVRAAERHREHLHLQRTVFFLVALTIQPQVSQRLSAIFGALTPPPTELNSQLWFSLYFKITAARKRSVMKSTRTPSLSPLCCPHSAPTRRCAHLLFQPAAVVCNPTQQSTTVISC